MMSESRKRKKDPLLPGRDDEDRVFGRGRRRHVPIRRIILILLLICFSGLYYLKDVLKTKLVNYLVPVDIKKPEPKPRYELRTSFSEVKSSQKHQNYGTPMDACRILMQCFSGSDVYGNPEVCKKNLDPTIKYYDSGYWVEMVEGEEDRMVGFVSIHHDVSYRSRQRGRGDKNRNEDYHAFIIYNVCVDESRRGKGVAKKMIPAFIDALIDHYGLQANAKASGKEIDPATGVPIPPLLIGLDVDLTSASMPDAFSLYAKLGFLRWWTPCTSVAHHKWTSLIETQLQWYKQQHPSPNDNQGNVRKSTGLLPTRVADFPLAKMLWDQQAYMSKAFSLGAGEKPTHFCMYKFYNDSFQNMASSLASH